MKTFAALLVTTLMVSNAFAVEPRLTKSIVSAIGAIVLGDISTTKYHGGFSLVDPEFDEKEKIWRFQATDKWSPLFPGSPIYFFEIRDKDSYFRIGSMSGSGYSPKSSEKFRMPPFLRKKINTVTGK